MNDNVYSRINQYSNLDLKTRIEGASPHELIHLLFQGARKHIATAQGHMQRQEIAPKGEHISKAIDIVEGLKTSLNHEKGGDLSQKLAQLYDYIQRALIDANSNNNESLLIEANMLIAQIHDAWQQLPEASKVS